MSDLNESKVLGPRIYSLTLYKSIEPIAMKPTYIFFIILFLMLNSFYQVSAQSGIPVSNFSATPNYVCVGEPVQFTDMSQNNPTSWAWTFQGGNPSSSTLQNPTIVYNLPGKYNAILKASNTMGDNMKGVLNIVSVVECTGITEEFENSVLHIFPNPTSSLLNIEIRFDAAFSVYDAIGSTLVKGFIKKDEPTQVSLDNLPSGIYFFQLRVESRTKTIKVIKN